MEQHVVEHFGRAQKEFAIFSTLYEHFLNTRKADGSINAEELYRINAGLNEIKAGIGKIKPFLGVENGRTDEQSTMPEM